VFSVTDLSGHDQTDLATGTAVNGYGDFLVTVKKQTFLPQLEHTWLTSTH